MIARGLLAFLLSAFLTLGGNAAPLLSDNRPEAFAGVPWGSTVEETFALLAKLRGVAAPAKIPQSASVTIIGGHFAGEKVQSWQLKFTEKKLSAGTLTLRPGAKAVALYSEFKQQLTAKYGPATGLRRPGGGRAKGHAEVNYWKFPPSLTDKTPKSISCELTGADGGPAADGNLILTLRYTNEIIEPAKPADMGRPINPPAQTPVIKPEDL